MIGITLVNELAIGVIGGFIGYKVGVKKEEIKTTFTDFVKKNKKDS